MNSAPKPSPTMATRIFLSPMGDSSFNDRSIPLARVETKAIARAVARTGLPVVDVSAGRHIRTVPWVETDDASIARLAVEHLLERGFRHLAYCGETRFNWSRWRADHVRKLAREK